MRRLPIGIAMAMVAMLAFTGAAFAWSAPTLVAKCAPDAEHYAWTITLPTEADYRIEWSFDQSTWTMTDFLTSGAHDFLTPQGGDTLYTRWASDHVNGKTSANANKELCTPPPTPTPTPDHDTASLNIKKIDADSDNALNGAVFKIKGISGTFRSGSGTWTVDGQKVPDGTDQAVTKKGFVCIIGFPKDSKWLVTEIQPPTGYELADPASQLVEVDDDGDCASPDVTFENQATPEQSQEPTPTPTATATPTPEQSVQPGTSTPAPTKSPEGGVKGATGTPAPSTPDTSIDSVGGSSPYPIMLFVVILLGSLGGLAYVNVESARKRG